MSFNVVQTTSSSIHKTGVTYQRDSSYITTDKNKPFVCLFHVLRYSQSVSITSGISLISVRNV